MERTEKNRTERKTMRPTQTYASYTLCYACEYNCLSAEYYESGQFALLQVNKAVLAQLTHSGSQKVELN